MKVELETEEARELFALIANRLVAEAALSATDSAALRRWRSEQMKTTSAGMQELTAKVNAEIDRALKTKAKSAVQRPDWR